MGLANIVANIYILLRRLIYTFSHDKIISCSKKYIGPVKRFLRLLKVKRKPDHCSLVDDKLKWLNTVIMKLLCGKPMQTNKFNVRPDQNVSV